MASRRLNEKPKLPDAKICLWEDLSFSNMDVIEKASTCEEIKKALHQTLCVPLDESDSRAAILMDLYVYTIQFAKGQAFNKEQTSTLFSIVRRLHHACTATSLGNVSECFLYFQELLFHHAVQRPPFSVELFNRDQVNSIIDYILDTYFRHFKLYKYAFTPQIKMDLTISYPGMPGTPSAVEEELVPVEAEAVSPDESEIPVDVTVPEQSDQELRSYIEARLSELVSELKSSLESRFQEGEQKLNQRLAALEALNPGVQTRSGRSRRK